MGRYLFLSRDDGRGVMALRGRLPAEAGALVEKALGRIAEAAPPDPELGGYESRGARMADALVTLAAAQVSEDADPDRACVVVHADAAFLAGGAGAAELEGGAPLAAETARRLACDAHVEVVAEGEDGRPLGVGRRTRQVPAWLARQIRHRDEGCRFPGCGRLRGA